MLVLLDECVPRQLRRELPGHEVRTVQEMKWDGKKNGALLELANGRFDVIVTVDQRIEYQQNLAVLPAPALRIIVLVAGSNNVDDLRPLMPAVQAALTRVQPREVIRIAAGRGS
jgi:uncharacterized protein DUF5615